MSAWNACRALGWGLLLGGLLLPGLSVGAERPPDPFEKELLRYRSFLDYGGFTPELESLLPRGYASRWRVSLGISGTYTDNVDQDAERQEAYWADGTFGLGWTRRSPRLTGTADYRVSSGLYQSSAVEGRNSTSQALLGALRWQAGRRLTTYMSGHVTQNLEGGIGEGAPGVRTAYANRSDTYGVSAGYTWRLARTVTNSSSYSFSYQNYLSDDAEGEDSRSHTFSSSLGWQGPGRSSFGLSYGYSRTEEVSTGLGRQNHTGSISWGYSIVPFMGGSPTRIGLTYSVDRGLPDDGDKYWRHSWSGSVSRALSPRTSGSAHVGYEWLRPEGGDDERSVTYGADLGHRFSEYTSGSLGFSEGWSYEPVSSRSGYTQITKTRRVYGTLSSRWGRTLRSGLTASYTETDADDRFGGADGDYREGAAGAEISGGAGRDGFVGAGYRFVRRWSEGTDDDYALHRWTGFWRRSWTRVWSTRVSFTHERRYYDKGSTDDSYFENRVSAQVSAAW